ncbi:MAG TPA: L,D-transpeptidase family protein [Rhizomicrobium sp.]|nr:L,D-transpeptidase family protein [Rhizomicrobium sp.]
MRNLTRAIVIWLGMLTAAGASADDTLRDLVEHRSANGSELDARLLAFYAARDFAPAWTGSSMAEANAEMARDALDRANEQGLRASDYTAMLARWSAAPEDPREVALYDASLTAAFLRYASDVHGGRFAPRDIYKDAQLPPQTFDAAAALGKALEDGALAKLIAGLPPPHAGYRILVEALTRYRAIAKAGGWHVVSGKDPMALAERLTIEDPLLAIDPGDDAIKDAVARFQRQHGLDDDGKVGSVTLDALNVPAAARMRQIAANLERWRWMPRNFERRYIRVNIPDQSVDFIDSGRIVLHSKAIVGRKDSPTPILRTAVTGLVANPAWDVPGDIAAKQLLPHLRRDPNYLAARNMVLVNAPAGDLQGTDIDWRKLRDIPYGVQQVPGPQNVLGALMLDMPNDFDVYLHDTGNKALFESKSRELSNGCVRVERISALASLVYSDGKDGDSGDVAAAVASGETERLALSDPVPVYILYWTVVPQSDGSVGFRPDFYGRDSVLISRLGVGR